MQNIFANFGRHKKVTRRENARRTMQAWGINDAVVPLQVGSTEK